MISCRSPMLSRLSLFFSSLSIVFSIHINLFSSILSIGLFSLHSLSFRTFKTSNLYNYTVKLVKRCFSGNFLRWLQILSPFFAIISSFRDKWLGWVFINLFDFIKKNQENQKWNPVEMSGLYYCVSSILAIIYKVSLLLNKFIVFSNSRSHSTCSSLVSPT